MVRLLQVFGGRRRGSHKHSVLPIRGGTDADVEKSVRKAMGIQVSKDVAKS